MALAVFWRSVSNSYHDGTFFELTLLTDPRFEGFAHWFASASAATLQTNRELLQLLVGGYQQGLEINTVGLAATGNISQIAHVITWWTLGIETLIALAFLWPDSLWSARIRNTLLIFFAVTTYSVATVRGFGWILMTLGLAQCSDRDRAFRPLFVATLALVQIYTFPFEAMLQGFGVN